MSGRDPQRLDPEDLIARARRGPLSPGEQRELERALAANVDVKVAYQVGADLDRATAVRGGDEGLIARAAQGALQRLQGAVPTRSVGDDAAPELRGDAVGTRSWSLRLPAAAAIALAVLSASGIATAWWSGLVSWPFARPQSAEPSAVDAQTSAVRHKSARRPPRAVPETQRAAPAGPAAEAAPASAPQAAAGSQPRRPSASAAERFHAANNARRSGESARAERLYQELIAAYPGSDESGLARVSLAKLRLARGDAAGAESEYRRYLASGHGQLSEEALVGCAQALGRLGRTRAEREAWQRLLADYPGSVYAPQARNRLLALQAEPAPAEPTQDGPR